MVDANRRFLEEHDHLRGLGIALEHQEEGAVQLSLPHDDALANPGSDAMQGGVVATLIDHAGGAAIRTTLDNPLETPHATTDLDVTYVRPATEDLVARATVVRSGRSMGVVEVTVSTAGADGALETVAVGLVSLHLDRD